MSARWCHNCGSCTCVDPSESLSDEECPLHDPSSLHGDRGDADLIDEDPLPPGYSLASADERPRGLWTACLDLSEPDEHGAVSVEVVGVGSRWECASACWRHHRQVAAEHLKAALAERDAACERVELLELETKHGLYHDVYQVVTDLLFDQVREPGVSEVRSNFEVGLTDEGADRAIALLNGGAA